MFKTITIDAVSFDSLTCETKVNTLDIIKDFNLRDKVSILGQCLTQAEEQYYEVLADMFFQSTNLKNRENLSLKNRVSKFAKKSKEQGVDVPNIIKLFKVCEVKLQEKTRLMTVWI